MDANSCAGCHNKPFGTPGGSGDFTTGVFVLGQRFDFASFDAADAVSTRGSRDENGNLVTLDTIGNFRSTVGMFGSGYVELLAREITADLQTIRDAIAPGGSGLLQSKGIRFGTLKRNGDGSWDTSMVDGLPATSLASSGESNPPTLLIRPFHQAGAVVSLREFTNSAYNHHHGIQSIERFGPGDPDDDGFKDELTEADVTAVTLYQAVLAVPGRVIPDDRRVEEAIWRGERLFDQIGCTDCHMAALPLASTRYTEPNPYNPPGNLQFTGQPVYSLNLNSKDLPGPRLEQARNQDAAAYVPVFTDFKLHDITSGSENPNREALDMHEPAGSPGLFAGNSRFLTSRLWGVANQQPHFHHGKYTTLREATLAHYGEANATRLAFLSLDSSDRDAVIEFMKSLQVLPPGSVSRVVNERGEPKQWPPSRRQRRIRLDIPSNDRTGTIRQDPYASQRTLGH
jgi:hypothetical protein